VQYALLVLGSAGRGESLLALDQDNAVIFAEGAPDGPEDRWFAAFGTHVADILHEVGVPYCKGGVMAKNPEWRGSAATWRDRVQHWIGRSNPQDLLSVDIFFDFRAVHGAGGLAADLWNHAYAEAGRRIDFLKLLAEAGSSSFAPAIGWFGIRTEAGRADLKMGGLFGIVAAARLLALRYGVAEHATRARLEGVNAKVPRAARDIDGLIQAHGVLLAAVLDQQLVDMAAGRPPSNKVEVRRLPGAEQERLKAALRSLRHADELVRDLLV
jgi:DNA polymerase-3 subunit epsilon/CBS domain-containing protein